MNQFDYEQYLNRVMNKLYDGASINANISYQENIYDRPFYNNMEFFTPSERTGTLFDINEGLEKGNLFKELYKPYKHYTPQKLIARTEQERIMLKIQELSFAINDLNLYLDLNPNDQQKFQLFKQFIIELKQLEALYADKYAPLYIDDDLKEEYTWYKKPWPWEGNNV